MRLQPMILRRTAHVVALLTALVAALVVPAGGCGGPPAHPAVGRDVGRLPIVPLAFPDGAPPSLTGKVTLLNFWGTWCPPCRRELPGLVRIADRLAADRRFQLVAVSCGAGEIDELGRETAEFLGQARLTLAAWAFADPLGRSLFASAYGLEAFPTTYLIGGDARIRHVWVGYRSRDEAEIARAVVELLKELPAAR